MPSLPLEPERTVLSSVGSGPDAAAAYRPARGRAASGTPARLLLAVACLAVAGGARALDGETLRIGIDSRVAAAALQVASSRGYFEREGLDVELVPVDGADVIEALAEEELELATASANALLDADDGGLELRGAYVLGVSGAADALVAHEDVRDTRRLRGRRVAVVPGSAGELVLRRALQKKGRRLKDVETIALAGDDAVDALLDGTVDAATLHGPTLAALRRRVDDAGADGPRVLATADDPRGLVSDLLVGTEDGLAAMKEETKGVIRALDRAVGWMRRNPEESVALLAELGGTEPEDVARALDGTTLLDVDENMTRLRGEFQKAFSNMSEVLDADDDDERAREVPSANRYLALSALRQVAAGR